MIPLPQGHPGNNLANGLIPSPLGAASAALLQQHHQQQHKLLQVC